MGVDPVVLGLGGVDETHVVGVADDEVLPEGSEGLQQALEVAGELLVGDNGASVIEDAQVQSPGVQVDAGVESVLLAVEAHRGLRVGWGPDPASWLGGASYLKIPRWDKAPP